MPDSLTSVAREIAECRACPRLVAWREQVAAEKRASFRDWEYWGRPVPGFGDPESKVLVIGLAPAAHGGNRTGRVFTGDNSGDWLYGAMHRAGLASQPTSVHKEDGLTLTGAYVCAAVRCAPPENKPLPDERDRCQPFLTREIALLPAARVVVPLGAYALDAVSRQWGVRPKLAFGHGREHALPDGRLVVCSYHPSQHNTFTGRLTKEMFDAVFRRAVELAG
ncbi:MAG: uracil-DNA glycosylase [Dehalococcoidia bacterium]